MARLLKMIGSFLFPTFLFAFLMERAVKEVALE